MFGLGIEGLVTTGFQDYSKVPSQVAPGFNGFTLVFPEKATPFTPTLFVTVTESAVIPLGFGPEGQIKRETVAQAQIVIGKVEDAND